MALNSPWARGVFKRGLCLIATVVAAVAALWLAAWWLRPALDVLPFQYTESEIRAAEEARDIRFDPDALPTLHQDVDYAEGPAAAWYPKGESPILAQLAADGHLPPVVERVGPEPAVLKGCESIGRYGGTWLRLATSPGDVGVIGNRMSGVTLVRWSPMGYPLKPHVARQIDISPDRRVFTFTLRRGMRWSDGHPFTADDILYWWEADVLDLSPTSSPPSWMHVAGEPGTVEKVDDLTVRFRFPHPNGLFLEMMAVVRGPLESPAHYLRKYHPTLGDPEACRRLMAAYGLPSRLALYRYLKQVRNPDHPRLWPWIYRRHKANPPQVFVRNPYFFAVDPAGNQLPYVDRLQFDVQGNEMIAMSAANGRVSMQTRHIRYRDHTEFMSRRDKAGTRILHWYPATRSVWALNPNLNRLIDPDRPETKWKAQLLADKHFRQALSLAINRRDIIKIEYAGQVEPAQVAPGPESPFHHETLQHAYTAHDPARANAMLDALGLTQRDREGFRTFPDGSRMLFFIDYCAFTGIGPGELVVEDWAKVGVRSLVRGRSRALFSRERHSGVFDFQVWSGASDFVPLLSPRYFVANGTESYYAMQWGQWQAAGGLRDATEAAHFPAPPPGHPMLRAMAVYEKARQALTMEQQRDIFREALDIAAENLWTINISEPPPQLVVCRNNFRNVPDNAMYGHVFWTPSTAGIETYFFDDDLPRPGEAEDVRHALLNPVALPGTADAAEGGGLVTAVIRWSLMALAACTVTLMALRHPFVWRRLLVLIPTLWIVSVATFVIIQLPPSDYLTHRVLDLESKGNAEAAAAIEDLKAVFHYEDPIVTRYFRWVGMRWFWTFADADRGLLQGHMGRSMATLETVNDMVGDRLLLTVLISAGTILFTWVVAIPIGIFSAVRQYSAADYVVSFIGFIGMSVPAFLLALILMTLSGVSGLFSGPYAAQPDWTWGKVVDLLHHIWIPIVVLGVGGTAGMIRVMRANLLDELKKPYVVTARAKGLGPVKLLLKHPVRVALNPFVSGIGGILPQLVSGGAIVATVLALPTVGPLLLSALFMEDMYLAGSMLMVLSLLSVLGTLASDLLLLWLDPRIRFEGGDA